MSPTELVSLSPVPRKYVARDSVIFSGAVPVRTSTVPKPRHWLYVRYLAWASESSLKCQYALPAYVYEVCTGRPPPVGSCSVTVLTTYLLNQSSWGAVCPGGVQYDG